MRSLLSIERTQREPSRPDSARRRRERGASQSGEETGPGSLPPQSQLDSRWLGRRGESTAGRSARALSGAGEGTPEALPTECAAVSAPGSQQRKQQLMKTSVLALIAFYQSVLSPAIPSSCRFYPTCSGYAYQAVSTWGVRRGLWLALRRILRCRPLGGYGYDPVPERKDVLGSTAKEIESWVPARS